MAEIDGLFHPVESGQILQPPSPTGGTWWKLNQLSMEISPPKKGAQYEPSGCLRQKAINFFCESIKIEAASSSSLHSKHLWILREEGQTVTR